MKRSEILAAMGGLELFGMRAAGACPQAGEAQPGGRDRRYGDQAPARAAADHRRPAHRRDQREAGSLDETSSPSPSCPFAKEIDEFVFADTPVNVTLVHDLAGGGFLAQQRNVVLVGGTGSGKTHLAVGIPAPVSAAAAAAASSTSLTWSTASTPRPRAGPPIISAASTSSSSTRAAPSTDHRGRCWEPGARLSALRPDQRPTLIPPD